MHLKGKKANQVLKNSGQNSNILFWHLRNHDLCSGLAEEEIKTLFEACSFKKAVKGEMIYSYNKEIDRIFLLHQGRIKVSYYLEENFECVSEFLKEGDIFGELTLKASPNTRCEFAQVLTDEAIVSTVGLSEFENIMRKNANLSVSFSKMIAEKLKIISVKYCNLVHKDVRTRVVNFFKLHAQYEGKWTGNKAEINMYCTHQEIANFTASSRQTVSTIINDLVKEKKIIYEGRSKLIIPNIKKLEN